MMTVDHGKANKFTVIGVGDFQFCSYCGETLDDAIDHEIWKSTKDRIPVLTCNCPEKTNASSEKTLFCPRCCEKISTKAEQKHAKHEVKTSTNSDNKKTSLTICCPFEEKPFEVVVSK